MIVLTAQEAGRALGIGPLKTAVSGVSTDTRSLKPGDLFVALRGERFDGHDYVEAALEAGACGAVVERRTWAKRNVSPGAHRDTQSRADPNVYPVPDTLETLGALARAVRRKSGALVLAVTGSAGKTSTKDILGAMVARVCRVAATAANQNNEVGVPLTLLQIEPDTQAVIVEMGMRGPGQIAALARVAEPDVGVITNVYPVHLELLGSLENIAQAKAELIRGLRPGGIGVVPLVCEPLESCLFGVEQRIVRFAAGGGLPCANECADVGGSAEPEEGDDVQTLRVRWPGGEARLEIDPIPRHTLQNVVAAAAACYAAGLPLELCLPGFLDSGPAKGRGEMIELPGVCLIDDTYNANPAATRVAIDNLVRVAARLGGRPVAVLGDMRELGPDAAAYHRETGEYAAAAGVRLLWGVGELSESTAAGFMAASKATDDAPGLAGHVASPAEASSVAASLRSGDVVLLKASRGVKLEVMVERIIEQARAGRWVATTGEASPGVQARRAGLGE
jgi:UDP-N-acetylmuramoyl-tripeptide--D-alanyl-D-alanine ligase